MLKNIQDKSITKRQTIEIIKDKLKEEKELHLRKTLSEDSFEKPDWSKYLAYQLGFIAALEKLDKFIPDPVALND
jgi:hypothetical protein